jgi:hypothetical protein
MTAGYGATHPGEQCHSPAASLPCPLGTAIGAHEVIARLEQAWAAWQYPDLSLIQTSASSQGVIGATSSARLA